MFLEFDARFIMQNGINHCKNNHSDRELRVRGHQQDSPVDD